MKILKLFAAGAALAMLAVPAQADRLDDIIASGKLRCAVTLDFPPIGMRDANNEPVGFDVDYCRDLAKALGVEAEIVETPFPDRIPALISGRADIGVASTSDTLERAKTIGFSIPYVAYNMVVLTKEGSGINAYEDLKSRRVGSTSSTFEALALEADMKKWADPKGAFQAYQNQADVFLALDQGHIEATVVTSTVASDAVKSGNYAGFKIVDEAPYETDFTSLITLREDFGLINYLNLFVNRQVRSGRYAELWGKWVGGPVPDLTVPGVYR